MASEAQIAANRGNALRSTGPKSERGKARAARNPMTHGRTSRSIMVFDENEEEYQAFREQYFAAFQPGDFIEAQLIERIVVCEWRLRRAYRAEADMVDAQRHRCRDELTQIGAAFDLGPAEMSALVRYEAALDRAVMRAHRLLERRQFTGGGPLMPMPEPELTTEDLLRNLARTEKKISETKPISPTESEPDPE